MPELPEVETVRRELLPLLVGRRVERVEIRWPRLVDRPSLDAFVRHLQGITIRDIWRRGKYLIFDLDSGRHWIVHLRMTGQLRVRDANDPPDRHTHARVFLDDGRALHYRDQRKFGRFYLVEREDEVVGDLGPEPLSETWRPEDLARRLTGRKAAIKALLLDQRVVAGIGNIYADEALFEAGIHPARPGGSLSMEEIKGLYRAIRKVLTEAIAARGSSLSTYVPPSGKQGSYQNHRRVFRRAGKPCPVCGTLIERVKIAGRSTHFCPRCQREAGPARSSMPAR